jgi:hypothetical protein
MTTITTVQVPELLQALIDSRLDTIDRMLLGRLPRSERLEIVREVESQIFELLQERGSDEPTREDILAVLGRLDPPEAYLPEELDRDPATRPRPLAGRPVSVPHRTSTSGKPRLKAALISGILGIASIVILLLIFPLVIGLANITSLGMLVLVPWYLLTLAAFGGGIIAVSLAVHSRFQSFWAMTGLVTGIIALLGSLLFVPLGLML